MNKKSRTLTIKGETIAVTADDFMSLTDMLKAKDGEFFISDWLLQKLNKIAVQQIKILIDDHFIQKLEQTKK